MDRKTVLVVEDNRDELAIYTTLLSYRGYTVLAAEDFDSALAIATAQVPDLAIIDVNLGDDPRDGCDLVAAFRAGVPTAYIPIIAHTAFGDVYRATLEKAGCQRIIHKPSNPQHILETVAELIGPPEPETARG